MRGPECHPWDRKISGERSGGENFRGRRPRSAQGLRGGHRRSKSEARREKERSLFRAERSGAPLGGRRSRASAACGRSKTDAGLRSDPRHALPVDRRSGGAPSGIAAHRGRASCGSGSMPDPTTSLPPADSERPPEIPAPGVFVFRLAWSVDRDRLREFVAGDDLLDVGQLVAVRCEQFEVVDGSARAAAPRIVDHAGFHRRY